jgi:hypothetical protein
MENFADTDCEKQNSQVVILPCKAHYFHEACISEWMNKQNICPVCRFEITLPTLKEQKKELEGLLKKIKKQNNQKD